MDTIEHLSRAGNFQLGHIGWRYYNKIKKKAMEQEFSVSGLLVSLSIAFFVVLSSALILNILHNTYNKARTQSKFLNNNIYRLEITTQKNNLPPLNLV